MTNLKGSCFRPIAIAAGLVALVLLIAPSPLVSGDAKVTLKASFTPAIVRPSETTVVSVEADIPAGFLLYTMTRIPMGPLPLKIDVDGSILTPVGEWRAQKPTVKIDPNFKKAIEYHKEKVTYSRAFKVGGNKTGKRHVEIAVRGQICDRDICIPFRKSITIQLEITPQNPRPEYRAIPTLQGEVFGPDRPLPKAPSQSKTGLPLEQGLLGFLIIAFLAGLGALATPCVFPMIPITVSFFSKFALVSMRRSAFMAAIYSISIVITYTTLGLIISFIFGAVGMQTLSSSAWFNLFLVILLTVFALNLFGLFEIQIPSWLISRSSSKEQELTSNDGSLFRQSVGVFFMALTFTMVSFTCTVGFMGVVLAEAATGNWFYPVLGMLVFSLSFSLPFFFLALFPSVATTLGRKAGDWMVAVKVVLGFFLIVIALKFLSNVDLVWHLDLLSRNIALSIWVVVFAAAGLYLLRIFNWTLIRTADRISDIVGPIRVVVAIILFSFSAYSATGIGNARSMGGWLDGWLPHAEKTNDKSATHLSFILNDIKKGMAQGKAQNLPLFLDFSGYTCTNCRYMEGSVFPRSEVIARLEKMVRVQANTDGSGKVSEQQQQYQLNRFGTVALPFYAIINPYDDTILATFPSMTNDIPKYTAFLDKGLEAFNKVKPNTIGKGGRKDDRNPIQEKNAEDPLKHISVTLTDKGIPVDFEFPHLFGEKKQRLSSTRGSWVFVNFWASWCAPCKKEFLEDFPPALAAATHIKLVTVAFDGEETIEAARSFAKKAMLTQRIALKGGEDILDASLDPAFNVVETLPLSYLIHPDGHIAWMHQGSVNKHLLIRLFAKTAL